MSFSPELLLIISVAVVGVLHTVVPDHWVPITLIARQRGWSKGETALAALQAGTGHVVSTLAIALVIWFAGVAVAARFGHFIDTAASMALIAFGSWIAISSLRELRRGYGHGHSHGHSHEFSFLGGDGSAGIHGPELQRIDTGHGVIELSIFEDGVPPRFRLSGPVADGVEVETKRESGARQVFALAKRAAFWESVEEIPEPHGFDATVRLDHGGDTQSYRTSFAEHDHGSHGHSHRSDHCHEHEINPKDDPLYAPMRGVAVLERHSHAHQHGRGVVHVHWHDHDDASHPVTPELEAAPPQHTHKHKTTARTALLLILGSSPMVEGIPAFFAAGKYGVGVIIAMAAVFAFSTIVTYVLLCVYSTAGLQRVNLGSFERYGEVMSGAFIALVGVAFWLWPAL
jgi:hypothetical protein